MFCTNQILNNIGLFLDIVGVVIIWKYGLPSKLAYEGISKSINIKYVEKQELYRKISRFGLISLIVGFGFQILSNFNI